MRKQTSGILVRAKARWLKDGEKNSKYFFGLERRNFVNKTISCIYDKNEIQITDNKCILKELKDFYGKLYQYRGTNLDEENLQKKFFY